jgi:hypothetical protein
MKKNGLDTVLADEAPAGGTRVPELVLVRAVGEDGQGAVLLSRSGGQLDGATVELRNEMKKSLIFA